MKWTKKWSGDLNFRKLCDFVAKGNLICLTGSGISTTLTLRNGKRAPDWKTLLQNIKEALFTQLSETEKGELDELLVKDATGENFIEAASVLYAKNKDFFVQCLADSVDIREGETSKTHESLLKLSPRGILTYNYDTAHENAIKKSGMPMWDIVLPSDNDKIIDIIKQNLNKPFLFKMHGSIDEADSMVLTKESYRNLFIKYPFYKAFMQQIFTNYNMLIVGFGMSDPDFEMLLQNVFSTFGSPIQEHIVIKHIKEKSSKDVIYRLRYGLNFLYIDDFKDIPEILDDCVRTPANLLEEILEKSISPVLSDRGEAHAKTRALCQTGKNCLAGILEKLIRSNVSKQKEKGYSSNFETSEYVYTYGVIADSTRNPAYKEFLIHEVVEKSIYSEPVAHALIYLRDILEKKDLSTVEEWLERFSSPYFKEDPQNPDRHNRVYKYCESAYHLLKAKYEIE